MSSEHYQKGFVGLYLTIIVLILMVGIISAIGFGVLAQQRIIFNTTQSAQAYAAAESGVEDALMRLATGKNWTSPSTLQVANASTQVTTSSIIGGARTVTAEGDSANRVRKIRIVYQLVSEDITFNFGAHIGNPTLSGGGLEMEHNDSEIIGNVFSNADVFGVSAATITDSVVVAGSGNTLSDITVNLNAEAYNCSGATILGDLEYNSAGSNSCSVTGSESTTGDTIATVDFPITSTMLSDWEAEAEAGGIVDGGGNVSITSNRTLGPGKITGNLTISNGVTLTLTGTLWVTGTFIPGNNAVVELDDDYGDLSGALIVEGTVDISNNVILRGSGNPGSFLLMIGKSISLSEASPAMGVANNADSAVLFAPSGLIVIKNNASLVEVTAHKVLVKKATVTYDVGLSNAKFTTGPGAGWTVTSWKEIE